MSDSIISHAIAWFGGLFFGPIFILFMMRKYEAAALLAVITAILGFVTLRMLF